ncbi:MAG: hypothetical protein ACRCT8_11530 [Lacipirellulaceae bacterium]
MDEFRTLVRALAEAEVEFILVGGVAAAVAGSQRSTRDIDALYRRSDENHVRIVRAIAPFQPYLRGAPPGLPFRFDEKALSLGGNFTLTTSAGEVDFLATIAGGDYDSLLAESSVIELFDVQCRVLDLLALIRVKRLAGRPKDFEAIAELELIADEMRRQQEG